MTRHRPTPTSRRITTTHGYVGPYTQRAYPPLAPAQAFVVPRAAVPLVLSTAIH